MFRVGRLRRMHAAGFSGAAIHRRVRSSSKLRERNSRSWYALCIVRAKTLAEWPQTISTLGERFSMGMSKRRGPTSTGCKGAKQERDHARTARLEYVTDLSDGIRREKWGRSFRYVRPSGKTIRDSTTLAQDQGARDSAGLERRADLLEAQRSFASDRPRRSRPQAVSVPRALARCATRTNMRN